MVAYAFQIDATRQQYGQWKFGWTTADGVPIQATMGLFDPPQPFTHVTLTSLGLKASAVSPAIASCIYQLNLNGKVRSSINAVVTEIGNWISNPADVGLVEARMTQITGDAFTGSALGAWLNLGGLRGWGLSRTLVGTSSALGKVELRRVGTTEILSSATVDITVTVT